MGHKCTDCNSDKTKPELFRGGWQPNEHGESHRQGSLDGFRCLDCDNWFRAKNTEGDTGD